MPRPTRRAGSKSRLYLSDPSLFPNLVIVKAKCRQGLLSSHEQFRIAMKVKSNPWLPWVDTIHLAPARDRGGVLAIIPTAGRDAQRLARCLHSLERAANGLDLQVVVVLCPATPATLRTTRKVARQRAEVIALPGPFNYCRSMNAGLLQRRAVDTCALFLNDDVTFTTPGDLVRLKQTLRAERWACVGPHIRGWHAQHSEVPRSVGAIRTNEPVVGACALWDLRWLDRVGQLDEEFGVGWGMDEADLGLRVVRQGGRFGRQDAVEIEHLQHATFGREYTDYAGPAHARNLAYFTSKYGRSVASWGESHHWVPLPGVQVSISAHNAGRWFERCLESVERALAGFRWVLVMGDDGSTDGTFEIARQHCEKRTSADAILLKRFVKRAGHVDRAKNRVIRMGAPFRSQYPAMCLMDADDEMGVNRVRHLLWRARDGGHLAVMGDHQQMIPEWKKEHLKIIKATRQSQVKGGFGPWATIFHEQLIAANGVLFPEDRGHVSNGDVEVWLRWHLRGVRIAPFPGEITHHYHCHPGTVSRPVNEKEARLEQLRWERRKAKLLGQTRRREKSSSPSSSRKSIPRGLKKRP